MTGSSVDRLYWVFAKPGSAMAVFGPVVGAHQSGPFTDQETARQVADAMDGIVYGVDVIYVAVARGESGRE